MYRLLTVVKTRYLRLDALDARIILKICIYQNKLPAIEEFSSLCLNTIALISMENKLIRGQINKSNTHKTREWVKAAPSPQYAYYCLLHAHTIFALRSKTRAPTTSIYRNILNIDAPYQTFGATWKQRAFYFGGFVFQVRFSEAQFNYRCMCSICSVQQILFNHNWI